MNRKAPTPIDLDTELAGRHLPQSIRDAIKEAVTEIHGPNRIDVANELASHFEDAISSGQTPERALQAFGDSHVAAKLIAREKRPGRQARNAGFQRSANMIEVFRRNVRFAGRKLMKTPGFTITALFSLCLGIGANTAIFSIVNAVLFRESPYAEPEGLVDVYQSTPDFRYSPMSYPDFRDVRDATTDAFSGVAGAGFMLASADLGGPKAEMIAGELVSGNFFELLGIAPILGRAISPSDDVSPGGHPVVMLTYSFWQKAFGSDPEVIGRTLQLNNRPYTIVGVTPQTYNGSMKGIFPDIVAPIMMISHLQPSASDKLEDRGSHFFFVRGRLNTNTTLAEAETAVQGVVADFVERQVDEWQGEAELVLVPTASVIMFPSVDAVIVPAVALLMGVVGLVLLIACANLASFLLAKAVDSRREISIRLAMGATRRTLIGQLLTENMVLALLGGGLGVALASRAIEFLERPDTPLPIPIGLELGIDPNVFAFSLVVSIVAGIVFGLVPALQATNPDVAGVLREEAASAGRGKGSALRNTIVVGQVAVSLLLLVTAGLFLRSLMATRSVDAGFGDDPTALVGIVLPPDEYSPERALALLDRIEEEAGELPGVVAVGMTDAVHLDPLNTQTTSFNVDGVEPPPNEPAQSADYARVHANFFESMGIPILAGRSLEDTDRPGGPPVVVVSQALAERFFPGMDPVGQLLRKQDTEDLQIVGVARDTKVRTLGEEPRAMVYFPFAQNPSAYATIIARTNGEAGKAVRDLIRIVYSINSDIAVIDSKTMEDHLGVMLLPQKLGAVVIASFAVLALLLACVGLYGTVSYAVAQRVREVGIRLSLGADVSQVVRLLTVGGLRLVGIGVGIGMVLSLAVTRLLSGLLFGIGTLDPVTFLAVPMLFAVIGAGAAYMPARRASRVDPVVALRQD